MQDNMLLLIKELIEIPSTKDNSSGLQKIAHVAQKHIKVPFIKTFEKNNIPSLFASNTNSFTQKFRLVLNAHLDVVPGSSDQYKALVKEGKVYGRGAADMKSAAAVMIVVFNKLVKKVSFPFGLQITTDEEIGGHNGTYYQLQEGLKTDFAISGELTNLAINLKAKGILQLKITATGKTAHSAYPWNGENAVWKLVDMLYQLKEAFPQPVKESWTTTINAAKIETPNSTLNKLPDEATVSLDIRFTPEDLPRLQDALEKIKENGFSVDVLEDESAQFTDKNDRYVKLLGQAIENVTRQKPQFIVKHGASDIRHFNTFSCPGIVFGPSGEGLHGDNEWVDIQSLETYANILEQFILSLE